MDIAHVIFTLMVTLGPSGGESFEKKEENPMLGWRGASRYCAAEYKAGFALECAAIRRVRQTMGEYIDIYIYIWLYTYPDLVTYTPYDDPALHVRLDQSPVDRAVLPHSVRGPASHRRA